MNEDATIVEGYGKDSKKEKALYEFANKYESIDFLVYDNSFKRNVVYRTSKNNSCICYRSSCNSFRIGIY